MMSPASDDDEDDDDADECHECHESRGSRSARVEECEGRGVRGSRMIQVHGACEIAIGQNLLVRVEGRWGIREHCSIEQLDAEPHLFSPFGRVMQTLIHLLPLG